MCDYYGERPADMSPTSTVLAITALNITGIKTPPEWCHHILSPSGRPDFIAINILAHIADQCLKSENGLYRATYREIADVVRVEIRTARNAVYKLIDFGVLIRDIRTEEWNGITMSNVVYWSIDYDILDSMFDPPEQKPTENKIDKTRAGVRFKIFKRDGYRCCICGRSASDGVVLEIDHKHPLSKGGSSKMENLWTLCRECNVGKSAEDL